MRQPTAVARETDEREEVVRLIFGGLDRLCAEIEDRTEASAKPKFRADAWPPPAMPPGPDRVLLVGLRARLASVAAAYGFGPGSDRATIRAVQSSLDSAHLAVRTEILTGCPEQIRNLIPTFVYLTVLAVAGVEEATQAAAYFG